MEELGITRRAALRKSSWFFISPRLLTLFSCFLEHSPHGLYQNIEALANTFQHWQTNPRSRHRYGITETSDAISLLIDMAKVGQPHIQCHRAYVDYCQCILSSFVRPPQRKWRMGLSSLCIQGEDWIGYQTHKICGTCIVLIAFGHMKFDVTTAPQRRRST